MGNFKNDQLLIFLSQANELLKQNIKEESVNEEKEVDAIADLLADVVEKDSTDLNLPNPILDRIEGMDFRGPVLAQFAKRSRTHIFLPR